MDQAKIGKFIAERRRKTNLTQLQLAEKGAEQRISKEPAEFRLGSHLFLCHYQEAVGLGFNMAILFQYALGIHKIF